MALLQILGLKRSPAAAPNDTATSPKKQVRFSEVTEQIPHPGASAVRIGKGRERSDAVIAPPPKVLAAMEVEAPGGKTLEVVKTANGRVRYTAPPPKVAEITFSGGGGKGTALPGAVKALYESGIL